MKKIIIILTCFLIQSINLLCQTIGGIKGGSSLTVTNTIVCGNEGTSQSSSTITGTNNIIQSNILSNFKDGMAAPVDTFSYYLSPTSTLRNAGINISGIPSKDLNGNDRTYDTTIDIGAVEYSEIYQNGSGTWNTPTGWNTGRIPTTDDVVTIRSATTVTSTDAVCKSIINIESGASLTINPAAQLIVSTSLSNTSPDRLIIKSSTTLPNGTLIFHNTSNNPNATVEMYSKAFCTNPNSTPKTGYRWQYFGIPVNTLTANPTFYGSYIRSWDETGNSIANHWVSLNNNSVLLPFNGYEITQVSAKTIVFQGQLINSDSNFGLLSFTTSALYPGQHIYSNPYTAAIDIRNLTYGSNIEGTVYLYNTGSFDQWTAIDGSANRGNNPGQYTAIPINTAGNDGLPGQIPSMQALLVKVISGSSNANNTFGISYNSVVMNNTDSQRAPFITNQSDSDQTSTVIDVNGNKYSDRMWLFTQPGCTHLFDNGWDGTKMMGDALTPQIFAVEPDGNYQVNTVDDVNNTLIGFQAGTDTDYTLTFTHQNLKRNYASMFLIDIVGNKTIDITESGSTYSFQAETTPNTLKKFMIVTRHIDTTIPDSSQIKIITSVNTVIVQNLSNQNGVIDLYDTMGRKLKNILLSPYGITTFQAGSITGTYIVTVNTGNERVNKKIILTR